jgi:intracellular multiplication protein IcmL
MKSMTNKLEQQKNFEYRDSFRWVLTALIVLLMVGGILAVCVIYKAIFPGQQRYYASMTSGEIIPLPSLSEPIVTNTYILDWASTATRAAFNLDFLNYQKQLDKASVNFTSSGWRAFSKALDDSKLLATVQDKKLMMDSVVSGQPIIRFQGVLNGRYIWRIQMPILISYGSASEQQQKAMSIMMIVSRVPVLDTATGLQITDFEAK